MTEDQEYLLGSTDDEQARLGFQHRVWTPETVKLWDRARIGAGQTIVDLGCGPGLASMDLAERVGSEGEVYAVDSSEKFLKLAAARASGLSYKNIHARNLDAADVDQLDVAADAVFSRWLFCFLEEPRGTLEAAVRCLKPGGRLIIMDYFNYLGVNLQPVCAITRRIFSHVYESFSAGGGSLDIGGDLPGMMVEAGLDIDMIMPICRAGRPGSDEWRWVTSFLSIYLPGLVESGTLDAGLYADFRREWRRRESDPGTFLFTPPMLGIVAIRQ